MAIAIWTGSFGVTATHVFSFGCRKHRQQCGSVRISINLQSLMRCFGGKRSWNMGVKRGRRIIRPSWRINWPSSTPPDSASIPVREQSEAQAKLKKAGAEASPKLSACVLFQMLVSSERKLASVWRASCESGGARWRRLWHWGCIREASALSRLEGQ
jgi:hypothetical protein